MMLVFSIALPAMAADGGISKAACELLRLPGCTTEAGNGTSTIQKDRFSSLLKALLEYLGRRPEKPAPVDPSPKPVDPTPVDPDPVCPDPVCPDPVCPDPVCPDPVCPDPVCPDPGCPNPVDPDPVDPDPVDPDPVDPDPVDPSPSVPSSYEQRVVELVNQERARNGLGALTMNNKLSDVARLKSEDMRKNGYFSHTSPTYGSPFDMMRQFGISYRSAGENIARGQRTPEEVVQAWMDSPGHRANILGASYTQIGVGYLASGNYWTQMFIG
ncbi:MAG: serine protease [Clostridiales bacterium]|nr:serine protease [Clostridiales bacterium]